MSSKLSIVLLCAVIACFIQDGSTQYGMGLYPGMGMGMGLYPPMYGAYPPYMMNQFTMMQQGVSSPFNPWFRKNNGTKVNVNPSNGAPSVVRSGR